MGSAVLNPKSQENNAESNPEVKDNSTPLKPQLQEALDAINSGNRVLADMFVRVNNYNGGYTIVSAQPTTVAFKYDTAAFSLVFPEALQKLNTTPLKTLLRYMVSDYHAKSKDNRTAIALTTQFLEAFRLLKRELWHYRSEVYTDEWKDERYCYPERRKAVRANNKKIVFALKKAKIDYEKAEKLEQFFNDLKEKYNVRLH